MGHRLFATTLSAAMGLVIGDSDLRVGKRGGRCHDTLGVYCRPRKVKAMLAFPMSAGRDYDEVLRLLDALQLNAKHAVATPVNWKPGGDVIIPTSVSDEDVKKKYAQGFRPFKPYRRTVSQPT